MGVLESVVLGTYLGVLVILALMGSHRFVALFLYYRHRERRAKPVPLPSPLPRVTIQLPLYNEKYVVDRLLDSVAQIRYPRHLLDIQVLDDSTDETVAITATAIKRLRAAGLDIDHVRRESRVGYKAGALDAGLRTAKGELILIFDADFLAPADILEKTVGHFSDPTVAVVQARWGHVNREFSLLTRVQAMLLDGHFVVEHGARSRAGRFFNFNGTAGVWRRAAIEDAGGWQHDTLTEDLDLSYRAQLRGWRFVYLPDLVSEAEVPVEMSAFKAQQQRWAKGSIQTCLKILPRVLATEELPWYVKAEATFHLTANLAYPLMVLLSLLVFPAMIIRYNMGWVEMVVVDLPLFVCATASVCAFYVVSQREITKAGLWHRVSVLPAALAVGIGLSISNSKAVIEALLGHSSEFARTPKFRVEGKGDEWRRKAYRGSLSAVPFIELALGAYFSYVAYYVLVSGLFGALPFIVLFQGGFLYTGALSVTQVGWAWRLPERRRSSQVAIRS